MGARENYGSGARNPSGSNDRAEWYRQRDEEIRRDREWQDQERRRLDDLYRRADYGAGVTGQRADEDRRYAERIREELDRLHDERRREDERHRAREERGRSNAGQSNVRQPCPMCRGDGVADAMTQQPDRDGNLTYAWTRETCRYCGGRRML